MPVYKSERLPNLEANSHFADKRLKVGFSHWDTLAQEHAIAFTVAKMMQQDLLADTYRLTQLAIEEGKSFGEFKKELKPKLMKAGWWGKQAVIDPMTGNIVEAQLGSNHRLRTIFHTNKHSAYAAGQWARIQKNKKLMPYLEYMPSLSKNPREKHREYYGLIRPVDDPIWQQIFPPNGYGCLCWVRQLSAAEAKAKGISPEIELEIEEITNQRTGEILKTPKGVHPSFAHNHDRLSAIRAIYREKLKSWAHIPKPLKSQMLAEFNANLNAYMAGLIDNPTFNTKVPTINSKSFKERFEELATIVATEGQEIWQRKNVEELRKKNELNMAWVVATISPSVKKALNADTNLVLFSNDTLVKMFASHPEITTLNEIKNINNIIESAQEIVKKDDLNVIYFSHKEKTYKVVIKRTRDAKELYLTTFFLLREKNYQDDIKALKKKNAIWIKEKDK